MQTENIPPSWKVARPQVKVISDSVELIEDVRMRIVVLECGHIIVRAPEWALHPFYECSQCYELMVKDCGGRL